MFQAVEPGWGRMTELNLGHTLDRQGGRNAVEARTA